MALISRFYIYQGIHLGILVLLNMRKKVAFTGDVLFQGGIGRTDFPAGDYETLISSIRTKLLPLNDDIIIIAGHGSYTTIGQEKRSNPFLNPKS